MNIDASEILKNYFYSRKIIESSSNIIRKLINFEKVKINRESYKYHIKNFKNSSKNKIQLEELCWSTDLIFAGWSINWYSIQHKLESKLANSDLLGGVKFSVLQQISSMADIKATDLLHDIQGIMELMQGGWSLKTYFIGKIHFMLLLQTNNWTIS